MNPVNSPTRSHPFLKGFLTRLTQAGHVGNPKKRDWLKKHGGDPRVQNGYMGICYDWRAKIEAKGCSESDMSFQSVSSSLLHTSSSSPTVLVASTKPHDKVNNMSTSGFDVCRNYQRGSCSYDTRCKFVHGANDLRTPPPTTSSTAHGRVQSNSMNRPLQAVTNMAHKPDMSNTNCNSGQSVVAQCQSLQPTHMGYVYFNTSLGYYASKSVSNNDSSTTKLEHGYWGGFSVKDYQTRRLLLRCDSIGDLYPVTQQPSSSTTFALLSSSPTTGQKHLGNPSEDVLRRLESSRFISCNKTKLSALYHACQLGKHTRLQFYSSASNVTSIFDIIHFDLWTSLISSESGIKYYAIF
uniref:Ribonuclease H-like domain-containing protein n=1 Tax=Tanacetum cinerariifolium TaxID=118510 RepID=A0A6L2JAE7_TANCI|nr:ribonuclease H-like domain-containing protein [Tanacetum cinerariifolium]